MNIMDMKTSKEGTITIMNRTKSEIVEKEQNYEDDDEVRQTEARGKKHMQQHPYTRSLNFNNSNNNNEKACFIVKNES